MPTLERANEAVLGPLLDVAPAEPYAATILRARRARGVGVDPRCVAADAKGTVAYVTNGASGTVSVVSLVGKPAFNVVAEIPVGTEPRGCALTPNGKLLFGANHPAGWQAGILWSRVCYGFQPELTDAWFACAAAFRQETGQDPVFGQHIFWIVTQSLKCFY